MNPVMSGIPFSFGVSESVASKMPSDSSSIGGVVAIGLDSLPLIMVIESSSVPKSDTTRMLIVYLPSMPYSTHVV